MSPYSKKVSLPFTTHCSLKQHQKLPMWYRVFSLSKVTSPGKANYLKDVGKVLFFREESRDTMQMRVKRTIHVKGEASAEALNRKELGFWKEQQGG